MSDLTKYGPRVQKILDKDPSEVRIEQEWVEKRKNLPMVLTDETATMPRSVFDRLDNYSCSIPSGTFNGKIWKRGQPYNNPTEWLFGEYYDNGESDSIGIHWRNIVIE